MTVHLPYIGCTNDQVLAALLEEYPQNIVGSFLVMCGYGFDDKEIPNWWIDIVLEDNQAQSIINAFNKGYFDQGYNSPVDLGFCIIVVADSSNPAHLSYAIQQLRMFEVIYLLKIMARHNIPAITEVSYPQHFLSFRYGEENPSYKYLRDIARWSLQIWEDYCSYLMSVHGQGMFYKYCKKINAVKAVKDEVKATVEKGSKPLVLTEGETDPIYIKTALELLGEKEILEKVDIEWVGASIGKGESINTGDGGLKNTRDVLLSNPKFLTRKVLLLYDCDTNKFNEDHELLKIRKIPEQKNRKFKIGIENLFHDHLYDHLFSDPLVREKFYSLKTEYTGYGEKKEIEKFQKMKFCKYICEERRQAEDFVDFKIIVDFIKDCLGTVIY